MVSILSVPVYCQISTDTIKLWNGNDLTGWELVTTTPADLQSVCKIELNNILSVAGKPIGYLATIGSYRNYKLHGEYRWPIDSALNKNSGVLVHIASGPIDRNTWPLCFQVQTKITRAGDILPMAGAKFAEDLSTPPEAKTPLLERQKPNSEKPIGEWNVIDIECVDGTIVCTVNGILQNRVTHCTPHAGKIGIQLEGAPFQVRNVWLLDFN
jgi:hypothetical protein